MKKSAKDPKVKKTLIRNYEHRVKTTEKNVVHDVGTSEQGSEKYEYIQKENILSQPSLCSSGILANYLSDVKNAPPAASLEELNIDKSQITKKLNFHFNDRIYKNLIELNANVEIKSKKDKRPSSSNIKKDLEPNIEDFYCDEKEPDTPPEIPVIKPKFKPVKKVECGQLHKLVAKFENL